MFNVSGGGNLSTDSPARRQKRYQSALRKFQRFTGSLWAGTLSLGGVMRERRCCDRGNFPWTRLSGCPGRNMRKPGPDWCRRSNGERRTSFVIWNKRYVFVILLLHNANKMKLQFSRISSILHFWKLGVSSSVSISSSVIKNILRSFFNQQEWRNCSARTYLLTRNVLRLAPQVGQLFKLCWLRRVCKTWCTMHLCLRQKTMAFSPKFWWAKKFGESQNVLFQASNSILFGIPPFKAQND